jgi:hypothetical protein
VKGEKKTDTNICPTQYSISIGLTTPTVNFQPRAVRSGGAKGAALLEALATKNRTSLRGPEGDSRILATLGAGRLRFGAHLRGAATSASTTFSALGFAALAPFRLVLETFVGEKHLFAGSKNKLSAALRTL